MSWDDRWYISIPNYMVYFGGVAMENVVKLDGHLAYLRAFGIVYGYLVYLRKFWYI
jgi:hypothetical protein